MMVVQKTTLFNDELKKFSDLANEWWDPHGKLKSLHDINKVRFEFIHNEIIKHFSRLDLKILDVGCGGGLISESLAKKNFEVTGIDASGEAIKVAKQHGVGLNIDYQQILVEDMHGSFDVVIGMEILEHVADLELFLDHCCRLVKKDGLLIMATINKNIESFLSAIVAAEYLLNWVEVGTHNWKRFVRPSAINDVVSKKGFHLLELKGMKLDISRDEWCMCNDVNVNYITIYTRRK